jgi:hypothetical protein
MSEMFALTFTASGEVHDADGNLIGQQDITETIHVTAAQAQALIEGEPS